MDIIRILMSIIGSDVAIVRCLKSCLEILTFGVLLVLGVGICAALYPTFHGIRH